MNHELISNNQKLTSALARRTSGGVNYLYMPDGGSPESGSPHPTFSEQVSPALPKTLEDVTHRPITHEAREAAFKNPANQQILDEMLEKGVSGGAEKDTEEIVDNLLQDIKFGLNINNRFGNLGSEQEKQRAVSGLPTEAERRAAAIILNIDLPPSLIEQSPSTEGSGETQTVQTPQTAPNGGSEILPPGPPTTESAPNPEQYDGPENIWSPEFKEYGRGLVKEIIRYETTMEYEVRYNEVNGPELDKLYLQLQEYVGFICWIRNEKNPWDPYERNSDGTVKGLKTRAEPTNHDYQPVPTTPEDFTGIRDLTQIPELYDRNTPVDQYPLIRNELPTYFKEAKRLGLLTGVDNILGKLRNELQGDVSVAQARSIIAQNFQEAEEVAETIFIEKSGQPDVDRLNGVWTHYLSWARRRFGRDLAGLDQGDYLEGEFRLDGGQELDPKEKYWRPSNYPDYYNVTARTSAQFQRAKETYLQMIRGGTLGLDPGILLPLLRNFAKAYGLQGQEQETAGIVTHVFMQEEREELEGLSYLNGWAYSTETYNPDSAYQYGMALAKDEGPQRWVRLARSGRGGVGTFLWKFDYDPRIGLYHNSGGSRGQIGNDTVSQNYLQSEIQAILIEEGMGIVLKDYDPNHDNPETVKSMVDQLYRGDEKSKREADKLREEAQKANLERIGLFQSHDSFKGLYEGFDTGNAHIDNYALYKDYDPNKLPISLRSSVALGRIQAKELPWIKEEVKAGRRVLKPGEKYIDLLTKQDKAIYDNAYAKAAADFDVAFQMVGVTGEKVRRGGGVFFVDRNPHIRAYLEVQKQGDYKLNLEQKRKQWTDSQWLGWILVKLRNGSEIGKLSRAEQRFYNGEGKFDEKGKFKESPTGTVGDQARKDIVDVVPTYLGEKFVQYAVTMAKMRFSYVYGDLEKIWERPEVMNDPVAQAIIDNNKKKKDPEDPQGIKDFKGLYKAAKIAEARYEAIKQFKANGFEAKHEIQTVKYDNQGNATGLEPKTVKFNEATESIFSRWTSHTYWGYQQENRHMLLAPDVFAAARRIRAGLSRPEDEKQGLLATQLLILDPTLKNVKKLPGSQMGNEIMLIENATEESYQDHYETRRKLFAGFLPTDANRNNIRVGYNREDYGGYSRYVLSLIPYVGAHSKRFDRRFLPQLANAPMEVSSMPDIWGQEGVLGAISMFADPIGETAGQRVGSQFAITKFADQMRYGWMMYGALVGYVDSEKGISIEGLFEKPTNNSDKLARLVEEMSQASNSYEVENKFFYELMETFGRLDRVLKLMRVMQSDVRNSQGALLTAEEAILPDGSFNSDIAWDRNTGTSRHSQKKFFDSYVDWLTSDKPGGGQETYPSETAFYKFLNEKYYYYDGSGRKEDGRKWRDWLFDKMCR